MPENITTTKNESNTTPNITIKEEGTRLIINNITYKEQNFDKYFKKWLQSKYTQLKIEAETKYSLDKIFKHQTYIFSKMQIKNNVELIQIHPDYDEILPKKANFKYDEPEIIGLYIKNEKTLICTENQLYELSYVSKSFDTNNMSKNSYVKTINSIREEMYDKARKQFIRNYIKENAKKIRIDTKQKKLNLDAFSKDFYEKGSWKETWTESYLKDTNNLSLTEWIKKECRETSTEKHEKFENNRYTTYNLDDIINYIETKEIKLNPVHNENQEWNYKITKYFMINCVNKEPIPESIKIIKEIRKNVTEFIENKPNIKNFKIKYFNEETGEIKEGKIENTYIKRLRENDLLYLGKDWTKIKPKNILSITYGKNTIWKNNTPIKEKAKTIYA